MKAILGVLPVLVGLLAPLAGRAEVSVENAWDASGRVSVSVRGRRAVFARGEGAVVVYSGPGAAGNEVARIVPFGPGKNGPVSIVSCRLGERSANGARLEVAFSAGATLVEGSFAFSDSGDLEVAPGGTMQGVSIHAPIAYGVLPGIVPDDVIYDPAKYPAAAVEVPAEGVFTCLLKGENAVLALAFQPGEQELRLVPAGKEKDPAFEAVELSLAGRKAWLAVMSAPAIWHLQKLGPRFMEKSVEPGWRRPFAAAWRTQLPESGVMTSFTFSDHEEGIWRPDTGSYTYPVWFKGDKAVLHLGSRILPEGNALIYAPEGHEDTPLALMKRCSPETAALLAGVRERKDYLPPGRLKTNVGFWHCWGTAMAKRTVYRYGMQAREREFLEEHIANYLDLEESNQARHQEYLDFAARMRVKLDGWAGGTADDPALAAYFERMLALLDRLVVKVREPMEDMTPAGYMAEAEKLAKRLREILPEEGIEDYPEYCHILERLNSTSAGMQEEVGKWFGTCVRDLYQQAAYACAGLPQAVRYAREIRQDIREMLKTRNWEVIDAP